MNLKFGFMALFVAPALIGCASYFKRKDCEKINWFEHGQKVAMRGDRLDADSTVNECRKVEADIQESQLDKGFKSGMQKYCDPANAYQVGRGGDKFVRDLCEGPAIRQLLTQHQKGLNDYCAKANAYQAGASGKKYLGVCTAEQEKDFMAPYRKGRKKWAETMIADKESLIREKDSRISSLEGERNMLRSQLSSIEFSRRTLGNERSTLEHQKSVAMSLTPGPEGAARASMYDQRMSAVDSQMRQVDSQKSDLDFKMRDKDSQINSENQAREQLRKEITDLRAELASLSE